MVLGGGDVGGCVVVGRAVDGGREVERGRRPNRGRFNKSSNEFIS